jgi:hypothetical protein
MAFARLIETGCQAQGGPDRLGVLEVSQSIDGASEGKTLALLKRKNAQDEAVALQQRPSSAFA